MSFNNNHTCHTHTAVPSLHQTLDELEFERGIWYASQCGDVKRVGNLLSKGADVNQVDSAGYVALHYAARNGHLDICKLLLKNKASIDLKTKCGHATALHRACSAGKLDVVKLLIENNADVETKDADGKTSLHRAAENQNEEICQVILSIYPKLKYESDFKGNKPVDYVQNEKLLKIFDSF